MSPFLLESSRPGRELGTLLRGLAAQVCADVHALADRTPDRVHDIRVGMKKFRALLRLGKPVLGRAGFAEADRIARDLKNSFGALRDDEVQMRLLGEILPHSEAAAVGRALGIPRHSGDGEAAGAGAAAALCARLRELRLATGLLSARQLGKAWRRSVFRTRRALRACRQDPGNDLLFHRWRKTIKTQLYQSAALGPPLDALGPDADKLASLLGRHHDLAVLSESLSVHLPGSGAEGAVAARKALLARQALEFGSDFLKE